MLTEERLDRIKEELALRGKVLAAPLAVQFGVSEDTIRRDLRELARLGFCRRVYGGALLPAPDLGRMDHRSLVMTEAKQALAVAVAKRFKTGETVFIDAGSTNVAIAGAIAKDLELTVVTNSPRVAIALEQHSSCKTLLLGGLLNRAKGACLGAQAFQEANRIFADVVVLGSCGVDADVGLTALDMEEADLKRCMVAQAGRLWVAATQDKLGRVAPYQIAKSSVIDVLFVAGADSLAVAAFRDNGTVVEKVG